MIRIDGSYGEGGGQILRTSLALSLLTSQSFQIQQIRGNRKKPGLMRQHLTAVNAAVEVSNAEVEGNRIGSESLSFSPREIVPGEYQFSVGTAGSATLVLQSILPALLTASQSSKLVLEGGTHNPFAPPFDFLEKAYIPLVRRMGPRLKAYLESPGFYPAGGGEFTVEIEPVEQLKPFTLVERGEMKKQTASALFSKLPFHIAEREIKMIRRKLGLSEEDAKVREIMNSRGPGNAILVEVESAEVTEVFSGFGELNVPAERVANKVVKQVRKYLSSSAPVGEYLADQLVLLMAIAQGGRFRTTTLSKHTLTNIHVIQQFLPVRIETQTLDKNDYLVAVMMKVL